MLTSIILKRRDADVARDRDAGAPAAAGGSRNRPAPAPAAARRASSSKALNTTPSPSRASSSSLALRARDVDTLPIATDSKPALQLRRTHRRPDPRLRDARNANSFSRRRRAAGRRRLRRGRRSFRARTPCARECIWNSQPPPSARPRTAATDRHERVLDALAGRLEVARPSPSKSLTSPACNRPSAPARSAPAEKGSFGCQITRPLKSLLGDRDRFLQPSSTSVVDRVHLGLEADHRDVVAFVDPHAHAVVLEHRAALRELLAEHRIGETLALVHRVGRARHHRIARGAEADPSGPCTPSRPSNTQSGSGAFAMVLPAAMSSAIQPRDLLPARGLPGLERTERPAVAPADREVHVARGVGDVGQVIRGVVEEVAEDRPQELRLRMFARAQRGELLRRGRVPSGSRRPRGSSSPALGR